MLFSIQNVYFWYLILQIGITSNYCTEQSITWASATNQELLFKSHNYNVAVLNKILILSSLCPEALKVTLVLDLLPPASEGWGKYCFHRCVSVHRGKDTPVPGSFQGQCDQVLSGGYPRHRSGQVRDTPYWPGMRYPSHGASTAEGVLHAADCMVLVFTQEDFLGFFCFYRPYEVSISWTFVPNQEHVKTTVIM